MLDFLTAGDAIKTGQLIRRPNPKQSIRVKRAPPRKVLCLEVTKDALTKYLSSDRQPLPMVKVAEDIGYGIKTLRKLFPEICKQISLRYLNHIKEIRSRQKQEFFNKIVDAVSQLYSLREPVNTKRVAEIIDRPTLRHGTWLPLQIRKAMQQLGLK